MSCQLDSGQVGHVLDRSVKVEDSSEGMDEENIIKIEVTVKTEDKENADVEKSKTFRKVSLLAKQLKFLAFFVHRNTLINKI